jgi:NCAIR mutase (PurE)-related protein
LFFLDFLIEKVLNVHSYYLIEENLISVGGINMSSRPELEKLTVVKLREVAHEYPEIVGATGMKKEELIKTILQARGEPVEKEKKKDLVLISHIKKEIKKLKEEQAKALTNRDSNKASVLRKKISKLKKQTRLLAKDNKAAAAAAPATEKKE